MSSAVRISESVAGGQVTQQQPKLDPADPRVKKLVYSMYRDMLSNRNEQANDILSKEDPENVRHDLGVGPILEQIIRQGSHSGSGGGGATPSTPAQGASQMNYGAPPPPPPMGAAGNMPSAKFNSDAGSNQKGPPPAIFGAMGKDKKPFTYTPGGIDLSEIRSPRMAKRIQMNAAAEGVTSVPGQATSGGSLSPGSTTYHLPPASLAAMQPQIQVPVLPSGGFNQGTLNKTLKPSDFCPQPQPTSDSQFQTIPIPPPVPDARFSVPSPTADSRLQKFTDTHKEAESLRPTGAPLSLASFMKQTVKPIPDSPPISESNQKPLFQRPEAPSPQSPQHQMPQRAEQQKQNVSPRSYQQPQRPEPKQIVEQQSPRSYQQPQRPEPKQIVEQQSPRINQQSQDQMAEQNSRNIPPNRPKSPYGYHQQQQQSPQVYQQRSKSPSDYQQVQEPKQAVEQSPHTYQPRQEQKSPNIYHQRQPGQTQQMRPQAVSQNIGSLYIPPVEQKQSNERDQGTSGQISGQRTNSFESESDKEKSGPQTPKTPQLNKAPVPWMNSRKPQQQSSPGTNTPWGQAKTIPIRFATEETETSGDAEVEKQEATQRSQQPSTPQRFGFPVSYQQTPITPTVPTMNGGGGRIIPIQVEGRPTVNAQATSGSRTPFQGNKPNFAPTGNSRAQHYSEQNNLHQNQTGESAEDPHIDPMQSKSFRVLQKITDDGDEGQGAPQPSLHKTSEPRFRGSNIPSKAFQTLRNHLPPSPGKNQEQEQQPSYQIPVQFTPTSHNIPIRMTPQSPGGGGGGGGTGQQYQFPVEYISSDAPRIPASQQKVSEPKMYMGKNIPSRSFKMLQQLTGEDSADPGTSALGSIAGADHSINSSPFLNPDDTLSPCNPEIENDKCLSNFNYNETENEVEIENGPKDFDPNECNWDPSSYWYYWWYCATNFWNGKEYEFPEGWENYYQYPYQVPVVVPSKSFRNLQKHFDTVPEESDAQDQAMETTETNHKTKVLAGVENSSETSQENLTGRLIDCDMKRRCSLTDIKETEESENEAEIICKNNSELVSNGKVKTEQFEIKSSDCELSSSNESFKFSNIGTIEEPETPSSESDDSSTLIGDDSRPNTAGLTIEEYFSDDSDSTILNRRRDRLSTIDELTESGRTLSVQYQSGQLNQSKTENFNKYANVFGETTEEDTGNDDSESESSSESSEDEASSVSVIENKSEPEIVSSTVPRDSSSESSSEDEFDELSSTVTARLPLRLSFSKSKSYRDIATVLVGDSEIQEIQTISAPSHDETLELTEEAEESEDTAAPTSSYTIRLSKSRSQEQDYCSAINDYSNKEIGSKENETSHEKVQADEKVETNEIEPEITHPKDEGDEIDFWSQIIETEPSSEPNLNQTIPPEEKEFVSEVLPQPEVPDNDDTVDFWSVLTKEESNDSTETAEQNEVNFWDTKIPEKKEFDFWESQRDFEFTNDYHLECLNSAEISENTGVSAKEEVYKFKEKNSNDYDEIGFEKSEEDPVVMVETNNIEEEAISESCSKAIITTAEEPVSVADESSDGSSSKSSGGTVVAKEDKSDTEVSTDPTTPEDVDKIVHLIEPNLNNKDNLVEPNFVNSTENINEDENDKEIKNEKDERHVPIMLEVPINVSPSSTCNCKGTAEKLARAENLLWRIERFLQETFLLGSENDSGILTDISRTLSDYETDNDGEAEQVARSMKEREAHGLLTKSGSFSRKERLLEKVESIRKVEEKLSTFHGTAAERKALQYERAKTHSCLFQLLQEECIERGEDDFFDEEDEYANEAAPGADILETPSATLTEETRTASSAEEIYDQSSVSSTSSSAERPCRLVPLPAKNYITTSLSIDSNSSQSGSSGILSPSSPVNRDQVLTDIISQFQQRHQQTLNTRFRHKKLKHFPSKIFKILQEEFGEEFYDTFDFGDEEFSLPLPFSQQLPIQISSKEYYESVQEVCTKNEPTKQQQQHEIQNICSSTPHTETKNSQSSITAINNSEFSFSNPPNPKARLARDLRMPKNMKKN